MTEEQGDRHIVFQNAGAVPPCFSGHVRFCFVGTEVLEDDESNMFYRRK